MALATGALELGALTPMIWGFRDRNIVLNLFEEITGLRMNHAYVRPGGVVADLPDGMEQRIADAVKQMRSTFKETVDMLVGNGIWVERTQNVGLSST